MNLLLTLLLTTLVSQSWAQEVDSCQAVGAKSVMTFPVQDQDGLGTCYANSAAILLQGTLNSPEPLSYHQLALIHSITDGGQETLVNTDKHNQLHYSGEGGWVCRAIEAAQDFGFCDANQFSLDRHGSGDPAEEQANMIYRYGEMIDRLVNREHGGPSTNWQLFEENLKDLLVDKKKACAEPREQHFEKKLTELLPSYIIKQIEVLEEVIAEERTPRKNSKKNAPSMSFLVPELEKRLAAWRLARERLLTAGVGTDGGLNWMVRDPLPAPLKAQIPNWIAALDTNDGKKDYLNLNLSSLPAQLFGVLGDQVPPEVMSNARDDISGRELIGEINEAWHACGATLDLDLISGLTPDSMFSHPRCQSYAGLQDREIRELEQVAANLTNTLRRVSPSRYEDRAHGLLSLLAPGCAAQMPAKKELLRGKSCNSFVFNSDMQVGRRSNIHQNARRMKREEKKAAARSWANQHLCQKRPVAISVCTEFMNLTDPQVDTRNCRQRPPEDPTNKHGNHAMVLVGYSVEADGKGRYLVQNSWGASCPVADDAAKGVVCEAIPEGSKNYTGRFWIGEDLLFNNTFEMSVVE